MLVEKRMALEDILSLSSTYEKIFKYRFYKNILGDCKIVLFDEETSNLDESFAEYENGKCGLYGLGNYTKTWVINSRCDVDVQYIPFGKTVDFDLNIFTYLNKIMTGRPMAEGIERLEVIKFFNYLKHKGFQYGIATALMERTAKDIDWRIFFEMLCSYIKFEKINHIDENVNKINLNILDTIRMYKIYRITNMQIHKTERQYDAICCCVIKAYIIKKYDKEKDLYKRVDNFILYCLTVLNCYFEKEIVLLSLYILDDERTKETFRKLNKSSNLEENIYNISWDIYHIRLLEQIMLKDNAMNKEQVILPYFATADKGLRDAMKINPLKAFVILDDYPIPVHKISVKDVCKNNDVLNEIQYMAKVRYKRVHNVNYSKVKECLLSEMKMKML